MDFDEEALIQDLITGIGQVAINDPTEEIWYHESQPESPLQNHHYENEIDLEQFQDIFKPQETQLKLQTKPKPKPKPNPEFQATVYTYTSEQNLALHDHERKDIIQLQHRFNQNCYVYRYKIEKEIFVDFLSHQEAKMGKLPHESAELLFEVKLEQPLYEKGKKFFMIYPNSISKKQEQTYSNTRLDKRVYKSIQTKTNSSDISSYHKLKINDEIRFGLETFKVVKINLDEDKNEASETEEEDPNFFMKKDLDDKNSKENKIEDINCKICLNNENTFDDPLINPCLCKGSCENVHFSCLRIWLDSYLQIQTDPLVDSYKWTKFECEICKTPYPLKFSYQGRILRLANFEIPNLPYVVFERIRHGSRKQIVIVKGQQIPIHVGRNMDCDFKIASSTVSRIHAVIEFIEGEFYLRDMDSKYGTLVRIDRPVRVEGKMKIQVGDLLIRFDLVIKKQGKQYVWKYD